MLKSVFLTGLGGQGVVTFAKILGGYASELGNKVSTFNSKGMAQRGGRVTSEIRITDDPGLEFGSRLAHGGADVLIGLELGESANSFSFVKEGGLVLLLNYKYVPTPMVLKKEEYPEMDAILNMFKEKTDKTFGIKEGQTPHNIFVLGVFASLLDKYPDVLPGFSAKGLQESMEKNLKRNLEENKAVFKKGLDSHFQH